MHGGIFMNEIIYFPVYLHQLEKYHFIDKLNLRHWEKTSLFYHPYILLSAGNYIKMKGFRERLEIPDDVLIFGDSGGHQIATGGSGDNFLSSLRSLRWYKDNGINYGIIFDIPPYTIKKKSNKIITFEKALKLSYKYSMEMVKRNNGELILYNVLHGKNKNEIDKWFNVMNELNLDRWCISQKMGLDLFAYQIKKLYDDGVKYIHVLGLSGTVITAFLFLIKKYFKLITFDSSSFKITGIYRQYRIPLTPNEKIYIKDVENAHKICMCPICQTADQNRDLLYADYGLSEVGLALHNLFWYLQELKLLENINSGKLLGFIENFYGIDVKKKIENLLAIFEGKSAPKTEKYDKKIVKFSGLEGFV
jgi:hypothetical protein